HARPDVPVVGGRRFGDLADAGHGRGVGEEGADGGAELLLFVSEDQLHLDSSRVWVPTLRSRNGISRSTCGSRGRPRTRSPMMLRWISSVPPAMDPDWTRNAICWNRPRSGASSPISIPCGPSMARLRSRAWRPRLAAMSLP